MLQQLNQDTGVTEVLVDATCVHTVLPYILQCIEQLQSPIIGFDIETEDSQRHAGLNRAMALNAESEEYKKGKKLIFDLNRTVITGFSLYLDQDQYVYYFNVAHADIENRIPIDMVFQLLDKIKQCGKFFIIHNAAFELAQCAAAWNYDLGKNNYICTMQMCVSAYNSDEYDIQRFKESDLRGIKNLIPEIAKTFAGYDGKGALTTEQNALLNRVCPKQSEPSTSYPGMVRELAYGYGLKKAVESWFGYKQTSFVDCLNGKAHMGLLTGPEVLHYGADDAYWCVQLYHRILRFMQETNPQVINTFVEQENPMPYIWAETWRRGIPLNYEALSFRKLEARQKFAHVLKDLIANLKCLTFDEQPSQRLVQKQKWYNGKDGLKYQDYRTKWVNIASTSIETLSDFDVCMAVSCSVSENWANEQGQKVDKKKGNITHYMMLRTLFHDLLDLPFIYVKGQIQSGGEARGALKEKAKLLAESTTAWIKEWGRYKMHTHLNDAERLSLAEQKVRDFPLNPILNVLDALGRIADLEQTMKLFLAPYENLVDPETHRIYPVISSLLNTRRMGCENPNGMQITKRGESTYVRGFFLPQKEDHVIVAVDWSQVELVLIGEESKDPAFYAAYGTLPYNDLHLGAAASAIRVYYPDFEKENLNEIVKFNTEELSSFKIQYPKVFVNPVKNYEMKPEEVKKFWRGSAGKTSNFGYWYSGSLMTVQPGLGWTDTEMWEATDNYRKEFPIAESWRVRTQNEARMWGFVYIFDGHRRTRYESTQDWYNSMVAKFAAYGNPAVTAFGQKLCNKIQRRAGNQSVNAKIQGGCATLAKRSIKRLVDIINNENLDAFFVLPIHDELVFSVHYEIAIEFSERIRSVMCHHPDLVNWLKLDGTISIGRNLEPYHPEKAPFGQIELDEAPHIPGVIPEEYKNKVLPPELRQRVVDYLMTKRIMIK